MFRMLTRLGALMLVGTTLMGCVPVAIGAVGAVAADSIAEDRGNDLF